MKLIMFNPLIGVDANGSTSLLLCARLLYGRHTILALILVTLISFKGDKRAYVLYGEKGKPVEYKDMLAEVLTADIVFLNR